MIELRFEDGASELLSVDDFEEAVRAGDVPADALIRYPAVTGDDFVPAESLELYRSLLDDPRARFERRFTLARIPRATVTLAAILAAIFVWQSRQSPVLDGAALIRQGAKSLPHQAELGEWWRLLSASTLHASWLHLGPNLVYLLYVGWSVESVLGVAGMIVLFCAAGVGAMAVSTVATPMPTVGASGMTFALFGAAIALGWRYSQWLPRRVRVRYGWPMLPFAAWFLIYAWDRAAVDNFCHLGGLLVGGLLGFMLPSVLEERPDQWPRQVARVLSAVLLAGFVGVLLPLMWQLGLLGGVRLAREPVVAAEAGYSLHPPVRWEPVGRFGHAPTWRSATGHAQVTALAWIEELEAPTRDEVRRRWVEELEESAVVVPRPGPAPAELGLGEEWFTLECDLVTGQRLLRSLRVGVVRGLYVTTVEFIHSQDRFADYARLRRRVLDRLELRSPRSVVRAAEALGGLQIADQAELEAALEAAPKWVALSPPDGLRLAAELARLGEREQADALLSALAAVDPELPELLYWELWMEHHLVPGLGGAPGGNSPSLAAAARAEALLARQPDSLPVAALCFDVLLGAGERDRAAAVLHRMNQRWPDRLPTQRRRARLPPRPLQNAAP